MITWKIYKVRFEDGHSRTCIFADGHDVSELGGNVVKTELIGVVTGKDTEETARITAELLLGVE